MPEKKNESGQSLKRLVGFIVVLPIVIGAVFVVVELSATDKMRGAMQQKIDELWQSFGR